MARPNILEAARQWIANAVEAWPTPDWLGRMNPGGRWRVQSIGSALLAGLDTPEDALKIAAVWRCVNVVSQSLAMLPWNVMKRDKNGQGIRQPNNAVEWLLHHEASKQLTAYDFKRTIKSHSLLWGNGYAEIEFDNAGRPFALHLLDPARVTPGRMTNGDIAYKVRQADGSDVMLEQSEVLHFHGLGYDGVRGYSVLEVATGGLATAISLDKSVARFFQAGFRPMGFLRTKGKLSIQGLDALEKKIAEYSGQNKRWSALPLDQDMEWQALDVTPDDAQLIDMRKFSVLDVCRWFGVPPHLAFDLDRATFSNIESQGREFLTYGLMHHIVQMEQEADRKLLTSQWGGLYSKINVNAIVRSDIQMRGTYYKLMLDCGALSVNEVRALEDLPDIGPDGDEHVRQVQYQPLGTELTPTPVKQDPNADPNATPPPKQLPPPKKKAKANGHDRSKA